MPIFKDLAYARASGENPFAVEWKEKNKVRLQMTSSAGFLPEIHR